MWIFTPEFSLSVIVHNQDPSVVIVRSRIAGDIEKAMSLLGQVTEPSPVHHSPTSDYPYRLEIARSRFAELVSQMALTATATNVKGAIRDPDRQRWMYDVYHAYESGQTKR